MMPRRRWHDTKLVGGWSAMKAATLAWVGCSPRWLTMWPIEELNRIGSKQRLLGVQLDPHRPQWELVERRPTVALAEEAGVTSLLKQILWQRDPMAVAA
jgi:hypothetical protein